MRHLPAIAGVLLGLVFLMASVPYLLGKVPPQPLPPEGSAMAHFQGAFGPTHYLDFVKVLELVGGLLVLIPKTRRLGLLVLGPIIVNILAFTAFIGGVPKEPMPLVMISLVTVLALYLVWAERRAFAAYLRGG